MAKVKVKLSASGMRAAQSAAAKGFVKQQGDHCVFCGKPLKRSPNAPAGTLMVCGACAKARGITPTG